uniref:CCHC-type domain-containing protein n=1 Tax=Scylla olivacea TaxID=85551 RepID=A0A0P4WEV4_SCYOL
MDGASGGGGESRGGGWTGGGGYDATNQIKQLLRIPTEDPGRASEERSSQKQEKQSSHAFEKAANSCSKQQSWEANRYQDRRRVDSPSGGNPRHMNFDLRPFRNYDNRHLDHYSSPSRNAHKQANYESSYANNSNFRNPHYNQPHHRASGGPLRDNKDPRVNGPRHLNSPHNHPIIVGPETESPEFRPSPEVLAELEEQFLYPLKKKSLRFPKAKYFCRLCDYHCDSLVVCKRHITDTRHRRLKEAKDLETTLKNVPSATDMHVAALDKLITSVSEEMKATQEMISTRSKLVSQLNDLLVAKVKGCRLEMVGSSVSGICLKTSDVNIDIVMDGNQNPSAALLAVKELVGNNDTYTNVLDDLSSSFPTMSFTHSKTGQRLVVGASSASSKYTNQLLGDYASIDNRVSILGVAFRYWAKLCQIDDQTKGTLPAHAFPVMLIHFLQQHQPPVLPVLHMMHPNPDGDVYLRAADIGDKWKTKNTESIGKLWLEMFRFYTIGFKMTEQVINVRYLQPMNKTDKAWSKKIAIEDPFLQKRNLTRTVSGNPVFEYILERFKTSYKYFAIPQLSYGPLFLHITFKEVSIGTKAAECAYQRNRKGEMLLESIEKAGQSQSEASSECELERTEEEADVAVEDEVEEDDDTTMSGFEADLSTVSPEDTLEEPNDSMSPNGLSSQEEEVNESILSGLTSTLHFVTPSQAAKLMQQVKKEDLLFRFEERFFTFGQKPPLICGSCQKDGHSKAECREDELPPLKKLPPINNHFLNLLTAIFEQLTRDFEPTVKEIEERDKIVSDLENYICQFFRGVTLKLFGSSANGFGFQRSDLDICLTFEGNPKGQNIDHIKIIESLAEKLKRYRQCGHVFAITTAKVPIVKFSIRRAYLEGDLSLYNTLALQNTKLLYTYARIDRRVKCLGYAMKYFAKLCDIGDASRGSLSSYAYILMVLHYLQQCKPPVIPVLQELYDHTKPAPQLIIDGWNAWFYDDLDGLKKEWKDYGKNTDTVGQLWVNMLRYYTETFNWKDHVVTIRQLAPLTRLQKLWNSRCIAIEDPFDLSHNLGAGLSRKMNTFIMKAFIRGREVFGTAVMGCPPGYRHMVDYLFDSKQLTDGAPPNDRGCRFCGKIGHIQKDCPKKKVNMEKREKKERQRDRRDISRVTNVENEHEESRKLAEGECNEEVKENPDEEKKKKGQEVSSATAKGGTSSSKSPEGNLVFNVPLKMMVEHCKKWESNEQYQLDGERLLGMKRYPAESFDEGMLEKGSVVCHVAPAPRHEKFIWTFDFQKARRSTSDKKSMFIHSCYGYILKTVATISRNSKQMKEHDNSALVAESSELPDNIGESLLQKMKEVSDQRKQKKIKKKVRLRKDLLVSRCKRVQGSETNNKNSNGPSLSESYRMPKADDDRSQKVLSKYHKSPVSLKTPGMNNRAYSEFCQNICSSSEEEDSLPTRSVRRKVKPKNVQGNPNSAHDRVYSDNRSTNKGKEIRTQIFTNKEGAIKAKHRPSFKLTHKLVAIGPEKEIVTISSNSPKRNLENVLTPPNTGEQYDLPQAIAQVNLTSESASPKNSVALSKNGKNGVEPHATISVMNGAAGFSHSHRAKHKHRARKGKRGGSKFRSDDSVNKSGNPQNPE